MVHFVFALLEVRLVILLAVLAGGVSAIDAWGPPELQAPVHRSIVAPIVQASLVLQHQLDHGVAVVHDRGRQLGWQ